MAVFVRNLGKMSYSRALKMQKELIQTYKNKEEEKVGVVLICEHHPPVYTVGLRERNTEEIKHELTALGAEFVKTRRGGLITFHGLGQLVCYPVLNLHVLKIGVRQYISNLEQAVINTCNHYEIEAHRTEHTGVWFGDNKLCAIGVQVSVGVAHHGLALNCNTDLSWFDHINPCGIEGKGVTSITQCVGRNVSVGEVSPVLVKNLTKQLGLELVDEW